MSLAWANDQVLTVPKISGSYFAFQLEIHGYALRIDVYYF